MKKRFLALALAALALPALSSAAVLLQDNFNARTVGALAGQGTWDQTGATATPTIDVIAGDVNIANLPTQTGGNSVRVVANGQDVGDSSFLDQPTAAGTTLYYSLAINVTDTAWVTPGGYFAHLTEGTATSGSGFRGRLWLDKGTTGFVAGIDISTGDSPTLATTVGELAYGQPHFMVVKLTYNAGATDDTAELFVNRVQLSEPASADASETGVDFVAIGRFGLRADSTNETPSIQIDQVRVGTTWADVVPFTAASVENWSMYGI